ncbi:MAG: HigA family addiction module antitoxin [Cytophagales bacterium]|nr:HigA family addiction module antitoxin [Cytophagales bacterium]
MKSFKQNSPPHPGELLLEFYLRPLNFSIEETAERLKVSRSCVDSLVNGRSGISASMANKLSKAFRTTPQYWLNMQANFDAV